MFLAQVETACEGAYQVCGDAVECRLACFDGVETYRLMVAIGSCLELVLRPGSRVFWEWFWPLPGLKRAGGSGLRRHVVSRDKSHSYGRSYP